MNVRNRNNFIILLLLITAFIQLSGTCTWPYYFANSQWEDSNKGHVTFTTNEMSGWNFEWTSGSGTSVLDTWRCHSTDWLDTDGYLILITTNVFAPFGTDIYGYLCLKLVRITDYSYRYYQYNPEQAGLYNERVLMNSDGTLSDIDTLCLGSATSLQFRPADSEYKLLIQSGNAASAKIPCPYVFLGKYDYTYTDVAGTVSCDMTSDVLDTCTDNTHVTVNHTTCPTRITHSVSETVWCVDTVEYTGNNYVTLYNGNDADSDIDDITIFRFSCMSVSSDGTSASITPNSCKKDHVPSSIPTNVQTNSAQGALISLTQLETCASCPALSNPQGGTVSYTTNGPVTTASYVCGAQYTLAGDATRICQSNLTWTSQQPTCTCSLPSAPDNGSVAVSSDGTTLIYACNVGFVLNGDENRTCETNTNVWTGNDPTCEPCDRLGTMAELTWVLSIDGTTTRADFTCLVNNTLTGSSHSTCLTDGSWDSASPTCVSCNALLSPDSGTVTLSTDGYQTTANFTCVTGYHLVGQSTTSCDSMGNWNVSSPLCECDEPTSPSNGSMSSNGTVVSYSCDAGSTLSGDSQQICASDGTGWTGSIPTCVECQLLTDPTGGLVNLSTNGVVTIATYSCNSGYTMNGDRTSYCGTDGSWNASSPTCSLCQSLTAPGSGNVTITTDGVTSQAIYTCVTNYNIVGGAMRSCDTSGTWSGTAPTCLCDHVTVPMNGSVVYDTGNTTAYYSCDLGYSMSGSTVRTCGTDGSGWSGIDTTCESCTLLTNITGGTYTLSTNTVNTFVDFTCDVGYTINGTARLTCQADGSWDSSHPNCATCVNLAAPTGGNMTLSTSGTVTTASFSCEVGYSLSGTSVLTCDENGDWDFTVPSCAKCSDRPAPTSGTINITTDGETTTATYSCVSGYTLSGQTIITCLPDGNWNRPEPTCDCDPPSAPTNGGVVVSGDDVTFSCDVGYSMSGPSTGTCQTDGSGWNISTPNCTTCTALTNVTGGNLTFISDGVTTQAEYTCTLGTSLIGNQTISCDENGTWSATGQQECVSCPTLSTTVNSGSVDITTDGSVTIATYGCVAGYYVKGSSVLTCTTNGTWDDTEPTCACDVFSAPPGGSVSISDDGLTATFGCDVGYTINGDVNISCATDGSGWSVMEPNCTQCDNLTQPNGGHVTYITTGTQTGAVYNCSVGSTISGTITQPTCQTDGTWDINNITCVTCPTDVLNLTNGVAVQETDGHTTIVSFSCRVGYDLVGASNITCLDTGLYDNNQPTCYCSDPPSPTNGAVVVSADRSVSTYSCDSGFILNGVINRTCQNDSLGWSDTAPTCDSCDTLVAPTGGTFTLTTNGTVTTAQFTCAEGYTLNGTSLMTCRSDGTWSHTPPSCAKCPDVTSPNSGNVTLDTNGEITTAYFTCTTGYYIVGTGNLTCDSNGNWDAAEPDCVCDSLADPASGYVNITSAFMTATFYCNVGYTMNGISTLTCGTDGSGWSDNSPTCVTCPNITGTTNGQYQTVTNGTVSSIQYTCDSGSTLNGSAEIECQSDGTWSTTESSCVECPRLSNMTSGMVNISSDGTITTATYTCSHGYSLVGQGDRSCITDGSWSGQTPYCVCDAPANITNGLVALDTNNTLATYTCDMYYTLSGLQYRSCLDDGTGWNGTEPTCVSCPSISSPSNGTVNIRTDGVSTVASFECDLGTSLQGQAVSTCGTDGQWSSVVPQCVSCGIPANIDSGNYTTSTNGSTTVVTYTCVNGYQLSGSVNVTCLSDASWDVTFPTCLCEDPAPLLGGYRISDGETMTYSLCEDPAPPPGGSRVSDGVTVIYSCDTGYTLDGDVIRYCGNNGAGWNGSDPLCAQCQTLPNVNNGSYVINSNGTTSTAEFQCVAGTSMNGSSKLVCLQDGSWDANIPTCVSCTSLSQPANGQYSFTSDGVQTSIQLQCNAGYDVTGTSSVTCQSDGTWDFQQSMTCEKTASEDDGDSLLPILIGVSVASGVIIIILSLLLARFIYLYYRGNNSHSYTPRSSLPDVKNSKIHHYDENIDDHLYTIPLVKLTPSPAPMNHQHHVTDKGPLSASPAPTEHGRSVFDNGITPRSPPPMMTGQSPRSVTSVSTLSLTQVRANMLPPVKQIKTKPQFLSEDTDMSITFSSQKTPLPRVFKTPKMGFIPTPSPVASRPSTPVNHTLSVIDTVNTPRNTGNQRSQTPVGD